MQYSKELLKELECKIQYKFNNPNLLIEALAHTSFRSDNSFNKDYDRLEFLGDSVINLCITHIIFEHYSSMSSGDMSKIRNNLVCKTSLYKIAMLIGLEQYIIMPEGEHIIEKSAKINALENILEAIIGAIYIDSNIHKVNSVVQQLWEGLIDNIDLDDLTDPKTKLQEICQANKWGLPIYILIEKQGEDHNPKFTIEVNVLQIGKAIGISYSKKLAEKSAASNLLTQYYGKR